MGRIAKFTKQPSTRFPHHATDHVAKGIISHHPVDPPGWQGQPGMMGGTVIAPGKPAKAENQTGLAVETETAFDFKTGPLHFLAELGLAELILIEVALEIDIEKDIIAVSFRKHFATRFWVSSLDGRLAGKAPESGTPLDPAHGLLDQVMA
jgi:hypothetical protein